MIITLYKNTQSEAETKADCYADQWQLEPYEPASLFCQGFTSEKADYFLSDDFTVTVLNNKHSIQMDGKQYEIFTNEEKQPGLRMYDSTIISFLLHRAEDMPVKEIKKPILPPVEIPANFSSGYVPDMINNEWEIF